MITGEDKVRTRMSARQYPDSCRPWRRKTDFGRKVDKRHGKKEGVVGSVKRALDNGTSDDGDGGTGAGTSLGKMQMALVDARRKLLHPPQV